ncbi:MAG: gamma-glutamylcyclotransferase [Candidatus Rifleibacteriota bacterium]
MTESTMNRREQSMNPNEPSKENTTGILRLFVYGTLKRGYWNHDRFCRGVLDVQEAVVRGRLYEMPSGIPVLEVPETDILAHGTADPLADVATQTRFAGHLASYLEPTPKSATAGDWGPVSGELLTFDDPSTRLPAIDRLEGFHPGGSSMYRRVLVPAFTGETVVPVWLYVGDEITKRRLAPLGKSRWL